MLQTAGYSTKKRSRVIGYNLSASTEWNEKRVNVNVSNLYTATGDYFCFVLFYALSGECVYVSFPFLYYRIPFPEE